MRRVSVTKGRLYSKHRMRRIVSGIKKEVTGQIKSMEKQKSEAAKSRKQSSAPALVLGGVGRTKAATTR
jgi:dissimilatory sulfite reductase (desulfoviridin) alpha/beta subunit